MFINKISITFSGLNYLKKISLPKAKSRLVLSNEVGSIITFSKQLRFKLYVIIF